MNDGSADTRLVPLRGMILAAGYGTRLAPVTDHVPKPLLPVGGRPLLDHVIAGCDTAGVQDIGVNTHHLADMVAEYFGLNGPEESAVALTGYTDQLLEATDLED